MPAIRGKPVPKQRDYHTQSSSDRTEDIVRQLRSNPLLDGQLVKDVAFAAATNKTIRHTLGRPAQGAIATRKSASATLHHVSFARDSIVMQSDVIVSCDLWIF